MAEVRVLVFSSSTVSFQEDDGSPSLLAILQDELRSARAETDWRCSGEFLLVTSSMKERALRMVERHAPDIVILRATGASFLHDDIASSIRRRWPRFYSAFLSTGRFFERLSGMRAGQGTIRRRLLFDAPRVLAVRVFGVAPPVLVEDAIRYVEETIDALAALETCDLHCRIAVGNTASSIDPAELKRRSDLFRSAVRAKCAARRVPFADNTDLYQATGASYDYAADLIHPGLRFRTLEGRAITNLIVDRLAGSIPAVD